MALLRTGKDLTHLSSPLEHPTGPKRTTEPTPHAELLRRSEASQYDFVICDRGRIWCDLN